MPKPIAYSATHDGQTVTRKSHRTYTHVVLVVSDGTVGAYSWVGRPDLVAGKVSEARKAWGDRGQVVVAPVVAA